jgi:hypothetical protein
MLAASAGVIMIVGGLLELEGYRGGWMLVAAAAATGAFAISGALVARKPPQSK